MFSLYEKIENIPPNVLLIFRYIVSAYNKRYGDRAESTVKLAILKRSFFEWYLMPCITQAECWEVTDIPTYKSLQSKMKSIVSIIQATFSGKLFENSSIFSFMNKFIEDHALRVDEMFRTILSKWSESPTSSTKSQPYISTSLESLKKNQSLSPTCLSTLDAEMLYTLCNKSEFFRSSEHVSKSIVEVLHDIESWDNTSIATREEKFIIMNLHELKIEDLIHSLEPVEHSSNHNLQILRHVLLYVDSVEKICTEMKMTHQDNIIQLLKMIETRERNKQNDDCIISCYIHELIQIVSNVNIRDLLSQLEHETEEANKTTISIIGQQKKMLRQIQLIESQVAELEKERKKTEEIFDNISVAEFIEAINFKTFIQEFSKSAFIEEQVQLIRNQYALRKGEITALVKELKLTEHQVERIQKLLQKAILTKVFRHIIPKISDYNINKPMHINPFYKEDNMLRTKTSQLYSCDPVDIGVPKKYAKICTYEIAQRELKKIDSFVLPKEKAHVIVNSSKIIIELMKFCGEEFNADDFLILLVFNLIRCNLPNLYSNLIYTKKFYGIFSNNSNASKAELVGISSDQEYWIRSFETAVMFLLEYKIPDNK